jgi:hypothetical protein
MLVPDAQKVSDRLPGITGRVQFSYLVGLGSEVLGDIFHRVMI